MTKKNTVIYALVIIVSLAACGKKYTFTKNWVFDTKKNRAGVAFQYKDSIIISAGEYLNINSPNHLIYCLDVKTGKVKWKFDVGAGVILHRIQLFKDKILLKSVKDKVTWLDALTGKKLKNVAASNAPDTKRNHIFNGNTAVAVSGNEQTKKPGAIICKNANGKTLWSYPVKPIPNVKEPYEVNFSFLIHGSNLILATYDGKVKSIAIQ